MLYPSGCVQFPLSIDHRELYVGVCILMHRNPILHSQILNSSPLNSVRISGNWRPLLLRKITSRKKWHPRSSSWYSARNKWTSTGGELHLCLLPGAISWWVPRSGWTGMSTWKTTMNGMCMAGKETQVHKGTGTSPKLVRATSTSWAPDGGQTGTCTCKKEAIAASMAGKGTLVHKVIGWSPKRAQSLLVIRVCPRTSLPLSSGRTVTCTCKISIKAIYVDGMATLAYKATLLWGRLHEVWKTIIQTAVHLLY